MERTVDGRFRLRKALGAGAFGEVWLAEDLEGGDDVALKLLKPEVAARQKAVERFAREVEVLRAIDNENVVRVVAASTERAPLYLAMELAPGVTLRELMWARASSGSRFTQDEIVHVIDRLTAALAAVHAEGAVHRDLKPTNVMVTEVDGAVDRVCLLDLGIAKVQVDASDQTTVGRMM
ncbi:MAG: serine/threonine-protein kinase, partial [Deltaproteobacteria bacterium]